MTLDGKALPAKTLTLGSATLAGAITEDAQITGDVGKCAMAALEAQLNITGNAAGLTVNQPMVVMPPLTGDVCKLHVTGTAAVTAAGQKIAFTNADLYAADASTLYRYSDLLQLESPGKNWSYNATVTSDGQKSTGGINLATSAPARSAGTPRPSPTARLWGIGSPRGPGAPRMPAPT